MPTWVSALSGDHWLNLDRVDGIDIVQQGDRHIVIAERLDRPNAILGSYSTRAAARDRVKEMIGDVPHA
jgi:hypothetical protein